MRGRERSRNEELQSSGRPPQILVIAGDEGNANVGDQAMFLELVRRIKTRHPDSSIVDLSRYPEKVLPIKEVVRRYDGYDYILSERSRLARFVESHFPHGDMLVLVGKALFLLLSAWLRKLRLPLQLVGPSGGSLLRLIEDSDLVLSCGGGYLNSVFRFGSLWPYCILYRVCAALGKPVFLMGQGIGPILYRMDKVVLRWGLKYVQRIALRDSGDGSSYLQSLGSSKSMLVNVGDDAVSLPTCSEDELTRVCNAEGIPDDRILVTAQFRPTSYTSHYDREYSIFARVLDSLIEHFGCHVVFVPTSYHELCDDRCAAFAVTLRMRHASRTSIVKQVYRPEVVKALIGMGRVALGVSYHFAVFGLTQGVPVFTFYEGEYYRLKFKGVYGHFGGPEWFFPFDESKTEEVIRRIEDVLENLDSIRQDLLSHTAAMEQRVEAEYELISSYIHRARNKGGKDS